MNSPTHPFTPTSPSIRDLRFQEVGFEEAEFVHDLLHTNNKTLTSVDLKELRRLQLSCSDNEFKALPQPGLKTAILSECFSEITQASE